MGGVHPYCCRFLSNERQMLMRELLIDVTQEDINEGFKCDCTFCPVARALARHIINTKVMYVLVDTEYMKLSRVGAKLADRTDIRICRTPDKARDFIYRFDDGDEVHPFQFTIQVPPEVEPYLLVNAIA